MTQLLKEDTDADLVNGCDDVSDDEDDDAMDEEDKLMSDSLIECTDVVEGDLGRYEVTGDNFGEDCCDRIGDLFGEDDNGCRMGIILVRAKNTPILQKRFKMMGTVRLITDNLRKSHNVEKEFGKYLVVNFKITW